MKLLISGERKLLPACSHSELVPVYSADDFPFAISARRFMSHFWLVCTVCRASVYEVWSR